MPGDSLPCLRDLGGREARRRLSVDKGTWFAADDLKRCTADWQGVEETHPGDRGSIEYYPPIYRCVSVHRSEEDQAPPHVATRHRDCEAHSE